jgi:uncharacterized glyoxalase superfamily protein PhnB
MKLEHLALQVPDPVAMAEWYQAHLRCSVARSGGEPAHARFLMTADGAVLFEIYRNPKASIPDYPSIDPLWMHLAFLSNDVRKDQDRLIKAGAQLVDGFNTNPAGDQLAMLRDPWGIPLQLVKRAQPML